MADKTVTVRLRALVSEYQRGMAAAAASTASFGTSAKTAIAGLTGQQMVTAGRSLTRNLSLPIAAVGVAATKLALNFDTSMARITALVGVPKAEVDAMRDSVLALGGETGRAPAELAEALFFITSAGIPAADAMAVLESSAKAAAVGLGDTATIADLVTSAMNAYGSDVLSAAAATDQLTAAVRLGKLEPSQLAGSMGRVLPIASALGVEFHEVAAAFAGMSRTGTNANEAATQLRGILNTILSPSASARTALEGVGLSVEGLHAQLRDQGLLSTLQTLVGSLGDNATASEAVFGNVRALSGVMDLLGGNVEDNVAIFEQMTDVSGELGRAFAVIEETDGHKMKQAWAEVQASLIELGTIIAPLAANFLGFVSDLISVFGKLPGPIQTSVVALAGLALMAGPILTVVGNVKKLTEALQASRFAGMLSGIGPAAGLAGVGLVGLGIALNAHANKAAEARESTKRLVDAIRELGETDGTSEWLRGIIEGSSDLRGAMHAAGLSISDLSAALAGGDASFGAFRDALMGTINLGDQGAEFTIPKLRNEINALKSQYEDAAPALEELESVLGDTSTATDDAAGSADGLTSSLDDQAGATEEATDAIQGYMDALSALFDPLFGAQDAILKLGEAQAKLTELEKEGKTGTEEYAQAQRDGVRAALAQEQALLRLKQGIDNGTVSVRAATETLNRWVAEGKITQAQANLVAGEFTNVSNKAKAIDGKQVRLGVSLVGGINVERDLNALTRDRSVSVYANLIGGGKIKNPFKFASGGLVPDGNYLAGGGFPLFKPKGTDTVPAMLSPGEFVMRKSAVDHFGVDWMKAVNSGNLMPASSMGGGAPSSIDVNVALDSGDGIIRYQRKRIKVEAGGSAEVFFRS